MNSSNTPQPPLLITGWVIWFAILNGLVIMQFFIGGGIPSGTDDGQPPALQQYLPIAPALLSLVVRFLIIPRISTPQAKLPVMLIGLALAEATGLLGIFLVDKSYGSTKLTHFVLSALAIVSFAPVYLKAKPSQDSYPR